MKEECGCGQGSLLFSFLLGGIVGAGIALLLAPKSGRETRQQISEFADEAKDKTKDYVETVKDKITDGIDKGKDFYDEKKSILTSALEAGKDAYLKEKEKFLKG